MHMENERGDVIFCKWGGGTVLRSYDTSLFIITYNLFKTNVCRMSIITILKRLSFLRPPHAFNVQRTLLLSSSSSRLALSSASDATSAL